MAVVAWDLSNRSSRGPVPFYGSHNTILTDNGAGVYLLLIDGPLDILAPQAKAKDGHQVVKLGRTNDLKRRLLELSCGLPPGSNIRYIPIGLRAFLTGEDAHQFERQLLDLCDGEGWSLGGEFAYAPLAHLRTALTN